MSAIAGRTASAAVQGAERGITLVIAGYRPARLWGCLARRLAGQPEHQWGESSRPHGFRL